MVVLPEDDALSWSSSDAVPEPVAAVRFASEDLFWKDGVTSGGCGLPLSGAK